MVKRETMLEVIIMTKRIYEIDVHQKELTTKIVEQLLEDNKSYVVLEETIFFPEGGGQPCDLGTIAGIEVLDVKERGALVYHEVESFPESKEVTCVLDWNRRLDHMQQHCGEHIVSGIIYNLYGGVNKGFHMGKEMVTIDIDLKEITSEMLEKIEMMSNDVIYKNVPIITEVVHTQDEAEQFPLRKKMTVSSDIRIVQVEDADCVACCGTHPKRTGEVGLIKIYKSEKNKGMTRLFFKCGKRALRDYHERHTILTTLMQAYSADLISVVDKILNDRSKAAAVREELRQLKVGLHNKWVDDHITANKNLIEVFEDRNMDDLKYMTKKLTEDGFKHTICFGSKVDFGVVLASSTANCGKIFKEYISTYSGRGGGSPQMAQGSFQTLEDMMDFLNELTVLI